MRTISSFNTTVTEITDVRVYSPVLVRAAGMPGDRTEALVLMSPHAHEVGNFDYIGDSERIFELLLANLPWQTFRTLLDTCVAHKEANPE